jgi:two-component system, OmpR family, phosphate regulon response regulator PhoB
VQARHVLLTTDRQDLVDAARSALTGVAVHLMTSGPFIGRLDGAIYCLVDWLLPQMSGMEMCRKLREYPATAHSHITLVLDDDDADAKRRALGAGADDYLVGPLTPERLAQKLREHWSNPNQAHGSTVLAVGDLTMDLVAHRVSWRGKQIGLMPNQFRLLAHFLSHPDQVFTRNSLIAFVSKDGEVSDERTVDVWVKRLRRAFRSQGAPDPVRTVHSVGYVLDTDMALEKRVAPVGQLARARSGAGKSDGVPSADSQ